MNKLCASNEQAVGKAQFAAIGLKHPHARTGAPQLSPRGGWRQHTEDKPFSQLSWIMAALISYY